MSRLPEPRRLMLRAPKDSVLRLALTAAHAREPKAADLRALSESLVGVIANDPGHGTTAANPSAMSSGVGAGTPAPSRAGGAVVAKLGSVLLMLTLAAGGFWWTQKPASDGTFAPHAGAVARAQLASSERSQQPVRGEPTPAVPDLAAPTQAGARSCANPPCAGPKPQPSARRADTSGSRPNLAPSSRTADAAASELQIIDEARQALGSSPARALALADQHENRFPHGSMAEEREVIRISALMSLGQTSRAQALAREFLRLKSGSAYARRVQAVLSSSP